MCSSDLEWYESLKPASLFSLKDFHKVFYEHCKEDIPSSSLAENCCDQDEDLIHYLENIDEDFENLHLEYLLEEIKKFASSKYLHNEEIVSTYSNVDEETE